LVRTLRPNDNRRHGRPDRSAARKASRKREMFTVDRQFEIRIVPRFVNEDETREGKEAPESRRRDQRLKTGSRAEMVETKNETKTENVKLKRKRVDFSLHAPEADDVKLAGDFTDWEQSPAPMRRLKSGAWKKSVYLPIGAYQYRFVIDGEWKNDPDCQLREPNPFGGENDVCVVE